MVAEVDERIARLRRANPAAADLAVLCSLAVRVEPELLRRLRLLLTGADVSAESDLWSSDVVSGASVRGLSLEPRAAEALRAQLRGPAWSGLREAAWERIRVSHRDLDWSLRLEEQVSYVTATGGADAGERIEQLLLAALGRLQAAGDSRRQDGIARWLLGALARLPAAAGATDAATAARLGAGLHLDRRVPDGEADGAGGVWLPWLLRRADLPSVRVPVRFTVDRLELNATGDDIVSVNVPGTNPRVLDIASNDGRTPVTRRVVLPDDTPLVVDVVGDTVELITLSGEIYRLHLRHPASDAAAPGGFDFSAERARRRPCLARDELLASLTQELLEGGGPVLIAGPPGSGKSVVACALADRLEHGGWVVAQHFYGVEPAWDGDELVAASIAAQRDAALAVGARTLILIDDDPKADERGPIEAGPGDAVVRTTRVDPGSFNRRRFVDLGTLDQLPLCEAILAARAAGIRAAFGAAPGDPAPTSVPHGDDLVRLAGANPGRLAGIIEWLLGQPVASATVGGIPASLTVVFPARIDRLEAEYATENVARWLAAVAVALPGFTYDDARRLFDSPPERVEALLRDAVAAWVLAEDPLADGTTALIADPSLSPALQERFASSILVSGHEAHMSAYLRASSPTIYQLRSAVHHALHTGDASVAVNICRSAVTLDWRAKAEGVEAALTELRAVWTVTGDTSFKQLLAAAESVAGVAENRPERFVDLLRNELRRRHLPADAGYMTAYRWESPLALAAVRRWDADTRWLYEGPTRGACVLTDGTVVLATPEALQVIDRSGAVEDFPVDSEPRRVAAAGSDALVAFDGHVSDFPHGQGQGSVVLAVSGPVTALASWNGWIAAGTASGTITMGREPSSGARRILVGHGGAVTAMVGSGAGLCSAGEDGTVRVWDVEGGRTALVFGGHHAPVRHLVELSSGDIVSGDDAGRILQWDPRTGERRRPRRGHDAAVTAIFPAPDGGVVSGGRDGALWRWTPGGEAADDRRLVSNRAPIELAAPTRDGFITWDDEGWVAWWDADGRSYGAVHPDDVASPVHALVSGPAEELLIHGDGAVACSRPAATGDDGDRPYLANLAADGEVIVAGTERGAIHLGPRRPPQPVQPTPVGRFAFVNDGRLLAAGSSSLDLLERPARAVAPFLDDTVVVAFEDGEIALVVVAADDRTIVIPLHRRSVAPRAIAATRPTDGSERGGSGGNGTRGNATGGYGGYGSGGDGPRGYVDRLDAALRRRTSPGENTFPSEATFPSEDEPDPAMRLIFRVNGSGSASELVAQDAGILVQPGVRQLILPVIALADGPGAVRLLTPGGPEQTFSTGAGTVTALAAAGDRFVVGTDDGAVLCVDPARSAVAPLGRHDGAVTAVCSVDPGAAVTAGADATIRVWDLWDEVEHAIVAGPEPFHALTVSGSPPEVFARAGESSVWTLTPQPTSWPQRLFSAAEVMPQATLEVPGPVKGPADPWTTGLQVTGGLTTPMEIRGASLLASDPTPVGRSELRVNGQEDRRDDDGRLLVPHVLEEGLVQISVRLVTALERPPTDLRLRLDFVTPHSSVEHTLEFAAPSGDPQGPDGVHVRLLGGKLSADAPVELLPPFEYK